MSVTDGVRVLQMGGFDRKAVGDVRGIGTPGKEKSGAQMREEFDAWADEQPTTVRCAHCPDWSFTGPAKEARDVAAAHREQLHPELVGRRTHRRAPVAVFGGKLDDESAAAARRARTEREEQEQLAKIERGRARDLLERMDVGESLGLEETSLDLSIPTDESPTDGGGVSSSSTPQTTEEETMGDTPAASTRQAILELLSGREIATKDIAAELGKSYAAVNTCIMGLLGEGLVTRVRRGVYTTSSTTTQVRQGPAPEPELEPEEPKPSVELEPAARVAPPGHPSPLVRLLSQLSTEDLELAVDEIEQMRRRLDAEHALIATALEEHEQAA